MPAEAFVGEIYMFAGNFPPRNTALCNGQLLPISQNTALFSLLGTYYGGNGMSNFALPNLQGSVPLGQGQSNTGSIYDLGQTSGSTNVTLRSSEMPSHTHTLQVAIGTGTTPLTATAVGSFPANAAPTNLYSNTAGANFMTPLNVTLNSTTEFVGNSLPHNNMQPYLAISFVVALQGVFPARS